MFLKKYYVINAIKCLQRKFRRVEIGYDELSNLSPWNIIHKFACKILKFKKKIEILIKKIIIINSGLDKFIWTFVLSTSKVTNKIYEFNEYTHHQLTKFIAFLLWNSRKQNTQNTYKKPSQEITTFSVLYLKNVDFMNLLLTRGVACLCFKRQYHRWWAG